MATDPEVIYQAFISYSHRDQAVAAWLQRALESYRVPTHLVGRQTAKGRVTNRIGKIFRDRSDLSLGADLTVQLRQELDRSQHLIVICSPEAARSRWVNEEVRHFKVLKGGDRIFCLIVDGVPHASLNGDQEQECLPSAICYQLDERGQLTDRPAEPLAADLRTSADGKHLALLKLIASMLGLRLDELVRRDHQRRMRVQRWISAAALAGVCILSWLTYTAISAQTLAEQRRLAAEDLVNFMLTDLRDKLEPIGRLDVLDVVADKVVAFYQQQDRKQLPDDALSRQATAMHLLGEMRELAGNAALASQLFEHAADTTAEILQRHPTSTEAIFNHSQSLFWVGFPHYQTGNYAEAQQWFARYAALAQQLVALEPDNPSWQLELFYALSNLAIVEYKVGLYASALQHFREITPVLEQLDARDPDIRIAAINNASWLASVSKAMGDFSTALDYRKAALEAINRWLAEEPERHDILDLAVTAHHESALMYGYLQQLPARDRHLQAGIGLANQLTEQDPQNTDYRFRALNMQLLDLLERDCQSDCQARLARWQQQARSLAHQTPNNVTNQRLYLLGGLRLSQRYPALLAPQQPLSEARAWLDAHADGHPGSDLAPLILALESIRLRASPSELTPEANQAVIALLAQSSNWYEFQSVCDALAITAANGLSTQAIMRKLAEMQYVKPCA